MKKIYNEIRRAYQDKKDLFNDIWYDLDDGTHTFNDEVKSVVASVLCCIPEKVRNKILDENCIFIDIDTLNGLALIIPNIHTPKPKTDISLIVFKSTRKSMKSLSTTLAHEIAHIYLKHGKFCEGNTTKDLDGNVIIQIEKDADDLIENWRFDRLYKDYKIETKRSVIIDMDLKGRK